jgi:hypothetical protein
VPNGRHFRNTALAWFRTNVLRSCDRVPSPDASPVGMSRRTVRGDTRMPSFNSSSDAIRSSPQVRLAAAISPMSRCKSAGYVGHPRGRDFQRQSN